MAALPGSIARSHIWTALPPIGNGVPVVVATLAGYVVTHVAFAPILGGYAMAFGLVSVLVAGWLAGMRTGIVVGALVLPLTPVAYVLAGTPYPDDLFSLGSGLIALVLVAAGVTVGRLHDVGDQLAAQARQLQEQNQVVARARILTEAVLDATAEAIVLIAPDGTVLLTNRRLTEFYGPEATAASNMGEFMQRADEIYEDAAPVRAMGERAALHPEQDVSTLATIRGPRPREVAVLGRPVYRSDGGYLGRMYVQRDVTHEREVDRMKTEFVSLVSHELRTPLTSIKGYVDLIMDGEVGEIAEEQREFLGVVKSNADRLVALINDLLDISRIEAGKVDLALEAVEPVALIRSVARTLRPLIEAKGQTLTLDLPDGLPAASADAQRLTQIVTNLLSNAHKYTPAGGTIAVTAHADDAALHVFVRDSGIGLSEEEQSHLFTKFFRAKNRTTQEVGGTGLGLAITKSLVEMHGGRITVESAPGEGSTFGFAVPLAAAPAGFSETPVADDSPPALGRPGARVLIVEDEPDIAQLILRYLERGGYQGFVAGDGNTAVQVARAEQPDLITLDVMLPGTDGLTVLEWLKAEPGTEGIPVLLLSILPDDGRGRVLGAVDYLNKPVGEAALLRRVGSILHGSARRRILVADDDADVRGLLAGHLRRAGHHVIEACDGEEALALARRELPDLALLDVRMPRMDGIAALRALRASESGRALPVVMMTASAGAFEESRGVVAELGAELMAKPCTAEELVAAIARGLTREVLA